MESVTALMGDYPTALVPRYQSGMIGPWFTGSQWADLVNPIGPAGVGAVTGQNVAYYIPVEVQTPITIYQAFSRNGATVNGNLDMALYDESLAKIVGTGSTAMSGASGVQVFNITDTVIPKGTYYCGFASDSATATFNQINIVFPGVVLQGCGIQVASSAFPLPNPAVFPGGAPASTVVPVFGFSFASAVL